MKALKFLCLAAAAVAVTSCLKDKVKPSITYDDGTTPAPTFTSEGGRQTVKFTSSLDWTASSSAEWLTFDNASGGSGQCTLTIIVAANDIQESREAKVTLISESPSTTLSKLFIVTQEAKPKPGPEPDPGYGEQTPFTQNCSEIGAYTATDSQSPARSISYSGYQHSFGTASNVHYFRYVDFTKAELTALTITADTLKIGSSYTLVTSGSDNGSMVQKTSETLTIVYLKDSKLWLEDKTTKTGYIIPIE